MDNRTPERSQHDSDESARNRADGGRTAEQTSGLDCAGDQGHPTVARGALQLPELADRARAYASKPRMARLRELTHQVFDQLWLYGYMSRDDAYAWMGRVLELPAEQAHIAKLGRAQLAKLRAAVKRYLRVADHRGELFDRCESRVRRRAARNNPSARGRHHRKNRRMR